MHQQVVQEKDSGLAAIRLPHLIFTLSGHLQQKIAL
jgi:hypothetical protein